MSHHTTSFPALGTHWWIELFDDIAEDEAGAVFDRARARVTTFEATYSRFKPDSLLTRLNQERNLAQPPDELVAMLQFAQQAYRDTAGVFNVLAGHILEERGYGFGYGASRQSEIQPNSDPAPGNPLTDLTISNDSITLTGHATLDFGGFGKGWLIDSLAEQLKAEGLQYFLINGGGDIYVTSERGQPIEIHLEHPTKPGYAVGRTSLKDRAFAASSPHKRQWQRGEATHTHLVAAQPPKDIVYLTAPTAAVADMCATTLLQIGFKQAKQLTKGYSLTIL